MWKDFGRDVATSKSWETASHGPLEEERGLERGVRTGFQEDCCDRGPSSKKGTFTYLCLEFVGCDECNPFVRSMRKKSGQVKFLAEQFKKSELVKYKFGSSRKQSVPRLVKTSIDAVSPSNL